MADQTAASLRVRVTADIADIKQGLAVVRGQVASLSAAGSAPASRKNPIKDLGDDAVSTSRVLAVLQPQITDIVTSLQGGMSFTTVALQQGGQIRDVAAQMGFGIKDIGKALLGLVTPTTLTVTAIGALTVAAYQGSQEQAAFAGALAKTGNVAGATTDSLIRLSESMAGGDVTQGKAADALAAVAGSGQIAAENFKAVAAAAIAMEESTGQSIDKTVAEFASLAGDPVNAVAKLNEAHHFLTAAVYDQIKALQEQGNTEAAAKVATDAYSDAVQKRAKDMEGSLGTLQKAWNGVKSAAKWAWDAMLDVGREESSESKIKKQYAVIEQLQKQLDAMPAGGVGDARRSKVQSRIDAARAEIMKLQDAMVSEQKKANQQANQQRASDAAVSMDQELQQYQTQAQKRVSERKRIEGEANAAILAATLSGDTKLAKDLAAKRDQLLAAVDKKYAAKNDGTASASRSLGLQQFENAADAEKAVIEAQTKTLQAQYQARAISASEYYAKLRALTVQGTDAQAGALEKEIAYLKAHAGSGKEAIATTQKIGELETKLATVRTEGAAKVAVLDAQEAALKKQREDAISSYTSALQSSTDALQAQMDAQVAHVGTGDRDYEIQQKLNDIYKEQAQRLTELALQKNAGKIDPATYDAEVEAVKNSTEQRVSIVQDGYQRMAEAQGEWSNGAISAWVNYVDNARNVAGQVESAMSSAFTGAEDALVKFVQTGKLSFTDLANSIIADLARIAAKQAITGMFGSVFNSVVGSTIGGVTKEAIPLTFATGGYTGDGGKFEPAGIVHKGEGVIPQWGIAAMGGPAAFMGFLGDLRTRRGYAEGGMAGIAASAVSRSSSPNVQINIENNTGSQISAQAGDVKFDGEKWVIKIVANNIASGGAIAAAGKGRFGWKDQL